MSHYFYKCFDCKEEYKPDIIEDNFHYLCPKCGKAEKNKPLKGVLLIEYDYKYISSKISMAKFLSFEPGSFWQYPYLWPLNYKNQHDKYLLSGISHDMLDRLSLQSNPVQTYNYKGQKIFLMDESRNPTLSYKDRASNLVALKALQLGINEIAAASTGNAGSSLAGICARLGIKSHLFVPQNIPDAKRIQIQSFGANVYIVDGDYDTAFDLSLEVSQKMKWYNRNTAFNPLTIEGKKSGAYDMFLATKGKLADYIFIPAGDGVIISGIYKGFWELKKLGWIGKTPSLIAVQSEGSDALVRYFKNGEFEYKTAETIADSICAGAPRNLYMAAKAVKESGGKAIAVSDEKILLAQKEMAMKFGILAEPAAAAAFAGYLQMVFEKQLPENANVMLIITGNGLKDISSLEQWNSPVRKMSYDKWVEYFTNK